MTDHRNVDPRVVEGFGDEWTRFNQSAPSETEMLAAFGEYFRIFPWHSLPSNAVGFDLGCGSGRWAKFVAPRVGLLHCIDASRAALEVAKANLAGCGNVVFREASVDDIPLPADSADFGYSLGVLHHIPDTAAGLRSCVGKLKKGAPFLLYIYYRFENRPRWYVAMWKVSDVLRRVVSALPLRVRSVISEIIAALVYWPWARLALLADKLGLPARSMPLSYYRRRSFYTMRTDARDRLGTSLERRFTRNEIERMMRAAGLGNIMFSDSPPYWCAVGYRE
jgi:SAM-dependent methyltransferase